MERTRLTTDLYFEMFGLLCVPIFMFISILNYEINLSVILLMLFILSLFGLLFYFLIKLKTIEFDSDFVYLITTRNNEEIIPLEKITSIKLSMDGINRKHFWKLKYINLESKETSLTFVPKILLKELFKFQELVKSKNPNAVIQNFSTTLDIN